MNDKYEIKWTELGLAFAEAKASREVIEGMCRAELAVFLPKDEPADNFLHTIVLGDYEDGVAFYVEPNHNGTDEDFTSVTIDACVWEEKPALTSGPHKGKTVMMPYPATKYRESD